MVEEIRRGCQSGLLNGRPSQVFETRFPSRPLSPLLPLPPYSHPTAHIRRRGRFRNGDGRGRDLSSHLSGSRNATGIHTGEHMAHRRLGRAHWLRGLTERLASLEKAVNGAATLTQETERERRTGTVPRALRKSEEHQISLIARGLDVASRTRAQRAC